MGNVRLHVIQQPPAKYGPNQPDTQSLGGAVALIAVCLPALMLVLILALGMFEDFVLRPPPPPPEEMERPETAAHER